MSDKEKKKKYLTIAQKLEIINELDKPTPPSKRSLGRRFNVQEGAIRYVWSNREEIKKRSSQLPEDFKNKKKQNDDS